MSQNNMFDLTNMADLFAQWRQYANKHDSLCVSTHVRPQTQANTRIHYAINMHCGGGIMMLILFALYATQALSHVVGKHHTEMFCHQTPFFLSKLIFIYFFWCLKLLNTFNIIKQFLFFYPFIYTHFDQIVESLIEWHYLFIYIKYK